VGVIASHRACRPTPQFSRQAKLSDSRQNEGIDIDNGGPIVGDMINQQTIFV